ncbi:MAG: YjgN family protein [Pseudomonadales bacterium]|nr:YjgN family protein [Pseudomonadales bacterium]
MDLAETTDDNTQAASASIPFEFRGEGQEYFKIWIVNLSLTIITLGIYSAWAKVRRLQYFYSNVYLSGESFRYLAEPIQILKGRLIAVPIFIIYIVGAELYPAAGLLLAILLLAATPYLVIRSLVFSLRMTSYKNVCFRFEASQKEAFMAVLVWPVLGLMTLGLLLPLSILKGHQFMVRNSAFGTTTFNYEASPWAYGRIYLGFLGILFLAGVISGGLSIFSGPASLIIIAIGYLIGFGYFTVKITNLYYPSAGLGAHGFEADLELPGYLKLFASNTLFIVLTLGLYLPFAQVRMAKYKAEHIKFLARGPIDDFVAAAQGPVSALGEEMGEVFDFDIGGV